MKKLITIFLFILYIVNLYSQADKQYKAVLSRQLETAVIQQYHRVEPFFREAYSLYPSVPRGILEAVSFAYTRFTHLCPSDTIPEDGGVPFTYGLMGLTLDGRGFFRDNLHYVAELSGFSVEDIVSSPRDNVVAYAAAYAALQRQFSIRSHRFDRQLPILMALSELPVSDDSVLSFALSSSMYSIALFVDNDLYRQLTGAIVNKPDFRRCFGSALSLLQAGGVRLSSEGEGAVLSENTDYDGAIWNSAGRCNYSVGRNGHSISAVTIHYTQGTYASSIAWFQNCTYNGVGARASAHYVIRSVDGQITQMVREADKAWHVGSSNPYTIGIEHEAYGNIATFFSPEMYQSSASLVRNICERHDISPHRMFYRDTLDDGTALNSGVHSLGGESACVKIRGHQHFPGQSHTDPGPFWDWNYFYKLVNEDSPIIRLDSPTGVLTDSGGPDSDYGDDERRLWLIEVDGARNISLLFDQFELEDNYDFLWIYDGNSVYAPLIGRWNTTSPGVVTSSGNALLVEFRSDCATTSAGWQAFWQADVTGTGQYPETEVLWDEDSWATTDFPLNFDDSDESAVVKRFYQVIGYNGRHWTANGNCGFAYENFDNLDESLSPEARGRWYCDNGRLRFSNAAVISEMDISLQTFPSYDYLYEFDMLLPESGADLQKAGIRFSCSGIEPWRDAYEMAFLPRENRIQLSCYHQGVRTVLFSIEGISAFVDSLCSYRVLHNESDGIITVFRGGRLLGEGQIPPDLSLQSIGSSMAFFATGIAASFDNLRVYRSRDESVYITVGEESGDDILWQSSFGIPAARVNSVIMNDQHHFSDVRGKNILVDRTPPLLRSPVSFGLSATADMAPSLLASSFHWPLAADPQSDILLYEYGTTVNPEAGETAISWIGTTQDNCIIFRPRPHTYSTYYFAVRAINGAGLRSEPIYSEICNRSFRKERNAGIMAGDRGIGSEFGVLSSEGLDMPGAAGVTAQVPESSSVPSRLQIWPNPSTGSIQINLFVPTVKMEIFDVLGRKVLEYGKDELPSAVVSKYTVKMDVTYLEPGLYFVRTVGEDGQFSTAVLLKQ